MLTFPYYWQDLQGPCQRYIADRADIKQAIGVVSSRIDAKTRSVCWPIGHRHQNIAFVFLFADLRTIIQVEFEPRTTMVAKKQLFQGCAVVEPCSIHEGYLLHLLRCDSYISIQAHTEGVGKIFPIHNPSIHI